MGIIKFYIAIFLCVCTILQDAVAADILIPTTQIAGTTGSRYYIISIGINNYQDSFWPTLKWPASDATRISDQIGYQTNNQIIKKLLINEYATHDIIYKALDQITQEARKQDTVILYVSGHGTLAQNKNGELERIVVLHDSKKDQLFATGLSHTILNHWLSQLRARKKMMIFATCHSGEGKSRLPLNVQELIRMNKGQLVPLSEVSEGTLVLAAAAKGEPAIESDKLKGDVYTHYLLEGLTTYDRNQDGMVSALEAHDYARDRTWTFTRGRQRPTANAQLIGDADIPLQGRKKSLGLPILEAYDQRLNGFYVQVDNGEKGRLPFAFPLNPYGSQVALYNPGKDKALARYSVRVAPGQKISLDQIMNDRPIGVGTAVRRFTWSDASWEKVSGSSTSESIEFSISYYWKGLGFGLMLSTPQEGENPIQPPINASVRLTTKLFIAQYRYKFRPFILGARIEYGEEKMDITLSDTSTGDKLRFSDESRTQGVSVMLGYNIASDFSITLEAGRRKAKWEFDTIGNIDGERKWISIGIDYQFGWVANTAWRN